MRHHFVALALAGCILLLPAAPAAAQGNQRWVASTGMDGGSCLRENPCRTFIWALSTTPAGGQVNCVDRADYGRLFINRSVTVDCDQASVLQEGASIFAGPNDVITLRGIQFDGLSDCFCFGIVFNSGGKLILDRVTVRNYPIAGIVFAPGTDAQLVVTDTVVTNNGGGNGSIGGISIQPQGGSGAVVASLTRLTVSSNSGFGVRVKTSAMSGGGVSVAIRDSSIAGNLHGVSAAGPAGTGKAIVAVQGSAVSDNTLHGVSTSGALSQIVVNASSISGNRGFGVLANDGSILTAGNNAVFGNGTNGSFSGIVPVQ